MGFIKIPNNTVLKNGLALNVVKWNDLNSGPAPCGMNVNTPRALSVINTYGGLLCNAVANGNNGWSRWGDAGSIFSYAAGAGSYRSLHVYKGTPPTQAELNALSGGWYPAAANCPRYADLLIEFKPDTVGSHTFDVATLPLPASIARQSGTATWFMLMYSLSCGGVGAFTQAVTGSVSNAAGTGELKITSVSIRGGSMYKLPFLQIPIKHKFSW